MLNKHIISLALFSVLCGNAHAELISSSGTFTNGQNVYTWGGGSLYFQSVGANRSTDNNGRFAVGLLWVQNLPCVSNCNFAQGTSLTVNFYTVSPTTVFGGTKYIITEHHLPPTTLDISYISTLNTTGTVKGDSDGVTIKGMTVWVPEGEQYVYTVVGTKNSPVDVVDLVPLTPGGWVTDTPDPFAPPRESLPFTAGSAELGAEIAANLVASPVPEPNSIALMGLAMAGLVFSRRRKS